MWVKTDEREFKLEVSIIDGYLTESFIKKNPVISRGIEMRGDDTLDMLHDKIFEAFNRYDFHLYEFLVGGKGPYDKKNKRYVPAEMIESLGEDEAKEMGVVKATESTTIGDLGLKKGSILGYIFDFGDSWVHQINVISIEPKCAKNKKYPRIVSKIGKSPPQYPNFK